MITVTVTVARRLLMLVHPPDLLPWPLFLSFLAFISLSIRWTRREPGPQNQHPHSVEYQSRSLWRKKVCCE